MNSIFSSMMGNTPFGNVQNLMNQYQQFRNTFRGDPQQKIQEMLNNGQITQQQIDQARSMATQLQKLMR